MDPASPLPRTALIKIPRQPRSVAMVHGILDAAMQVIEKEGLPAMSTHRVAERAGVSTGSLYQYFANRESILAGIIERALLHIAGVMESMRHTGLDLPLRDAIRGPALLLLRYYDPYLPVVRTILREAPLLADNGLILSIERMLVDTIRDYLLHNAHRYRMRDGLAGVHVAASAIVLLYLRWIAQPLARITEEQFVDTVTNLVCSLIEKTG